MHKDSIVVARPGALREAVDDSHLNVAALVTETGVGRATIYNLMAKPGYGVAKDKAQRITYALDLPVGAIFMHRDGAALA